MVSPLLSSMSISRDGGSPVTRWASAISSSVVSPMALTTTTTSDPASINSRMRRATRRNFIGVATLDPPYFWTTRVTPTRPPWCRSCAAARTIVLPLTPAPPLAARASPRRSAQGPAASARRPTDRRPQGRHPTLRRRLAASTISRAPVMSAKRASWCQRSCIATRSPAWSPSGERPDQQRAAARVEDRVCSAEASRAPPGATRWS